MRGSVLSIGAVAGFSAALASGAACSSSSSSSTGGPGSDASTSDVSPGADAGPPVDATSAEATVEASVTGMKIVTMNGGPLQGAAGDALRLEVVLTLSDGTTTPLPFGTPTTWSAPLTVTALDPENPGSKSVLPDAGAAPTAIFVDNPYRLERSDYAGTLFLLDPGTAQGGGSLAVSATVADAGTVSATVMVGPTPAGDPDAGANLYVNVSNCSDCHGATGDGTPPTKTDAGVVYIIKGTPYPFPAPGLNDLTVKGSPNLAADPAWNAALLGMASLGDLDNQGVALRLPMPDWLGKSGLDGGPLGAQDFADLYAFLKTQRQ